MGCLSRGSGRCVLKEASKEGSGRCSKGLRAGAELGPAALVPEGALDLRITGEVMPSGLFRIRGQARG